MRKPRGKSRSAESSTDAKKKWAAFRDIPRVISDWKKRIMRRMVEPNLIHRMKHDQYRKKVIRIYDGHRGALLVRSSQLSGHLRYGDRLFRRQHFDLDGMKNILDIGSGAGQVLAHLLKYSSENTRITGIDLSRTMIERARKRLQSNRPRLIVGDLSRLPFPPETFDCVTCCYVLEHLPDAQLGLQEIARVLVPRGRVLLFVTEDNFGGAWTSRFWKCRTHNRESLLNLCQSLGLELKKEFWFTRLHRWFRAGGICVELVKAAPQPAAANDFDETSTTRTTFVPPVPESALSNSGLRVLQSEPVEGETSVSTRTRSIVSSN